MKKAFFFLLLIFLSYNISYCQLLKNPPLSVEDFEIALNNPDHLRRLLIQHHLDYTPGTVGKLNMFTKFNPLSPDLESVKSEIWRMKSPYQNTSSDFGSGIINRLIIYDWKNGYSPKPEVIRTIIIFLNENFINTVEVNRFFESIKNKYTKVDTSRDREFYQEDLFDIFSNDYNSKIQIRTGKTWIEPAWLSTGYNISFDLLK